MTTLCAYTIRNCHECTASKTNKVKYGKASVVIIAKLPFEILSNDIVQPIKKRLFKTELSENDFYILIITDVFSRRTKVDMICDIKSRTLCKRIENYLKNQKKEVKKFITVKGDNTCTKIPKTY